ncbi:hypothetical protein [Hyphomonas pacifica]|uniref:Uncharacterized protein n=1 Tax=Hyphomonas pacifica TaxID=1280941 RepID=A0A062TYL3_9PROT|nr:hypothetical protein [Hyphomonas pacifica]KCZ51112.1 hypothetical protein HY2_12795 [Hyphomonas pacifica]RAN35105.1 hypothetical protein HY11_14310 [Hyphomonas pacifica]RAN35466.1 hypothetical protein HY3_07960 [Hyphomonas pacifica]
MRAPLLVVAALLLSACSQPTVQEAEFMQRLSALCGKAFEGRIVSDDAEDDAWRAERIVMHVRSCGKDEIRIPLHVGDDRSRIWVIHRERDRLALHHEHRHEDGSLDPVTGYGGVRDDRFSGSRLNFPADEATKALFDANGIPESGDNIWAIEVRPTHNLFAYEMERPGRFFRVEFDTSKPIDIPPAPWGLD